MEGNENIYASVKEPPEGSFVSIESGPYHICALTEENGSINVGDEMMWVKQTFQ